MGSSSTYDRCTLHPHEGRVVGICAPCLRERLACLIESTDASAAAAGDKDLYAVEDESLNTKSMSANMPGAPHEYGGGARSRSTKASNSAEEMNIAGFRHLQYHHSQLSHACNLEDPPVHKVKLSFDVARGSPAYQGVKKVVPTASPLNIPSISGRRRSSTNEKQHLASRRQSCEIKNAGGGEIGAVAAPPPAVKKRSSWFSMTSKGSKNSPSLINSPLPGGKSPAYLNILAGRKSASDAVGHYSSCNNYMRPSQYAAAPELEAISEINLGEAAIQVGGGAGSIRDSVHAAANSSWISSLFQRSRKAGSRMTSKLQLASTADQVGAQCTAAAAGAGGMLSNDYDNNTAVPGSHDEKAAARAYKLPSNYGGSNIKQSVVDAGRLSLDGARSNFKALQLLKKEARLISKQQLQQNEDDYISAQQATNDQSLPAKCKTAASAADVAGPRRNVSNVLQGPASPSPNISQYCANANNIVGMEYNMGDLDGEFPRSQSTSGRAWSRTLSPLLGFKNGHGTRRLTAMDNDPAATQLYFDHIQQQHGPAGFLNSTRNLIGSNIVPGSASSNYLSSPLNYTRSKLGPPDNAAQYIQFA